MDKAARVVRRSGVKLMSLGGGHTDLHVLLSEVKDMRNTARAFMNAQNAVSQDFLKWAVNEENRALQDVANQLAELNLLWTEVQREFGEHLKDYRHMFEMILEGERHVAQSRNNFMACEQREMKVRKELKKAFKKSSTSEIQTLEVRLSQAERAKDLAQMEVTDRIRENEAVKLIRLKEGLIKLSQAYSDFARKCAVIFDSQQDIAQQLPDVLDQDLEDIKYTGSGVTRYKVQQAKEKVHNYRRSRDHYSIHAKFNDPPPPYSVSDDNLQNSSSITSSSQTASPRRRINTGMEAQSAPDMASLPAQPSAPPLATAAPLTSSPTSAPPEVPADSVMLHAAVHPSASLSNPPHPTPTLYSKELERSLSPIPVLTDSGRLEISGLVDLHPDWDNSYEDDLSGAMGGATI
ncbi:hypothetical protein BsWGS_18867 [Bradybaena similaris]